MNKILNNDFRTILRESRKKKGDSKKKWRGGGERKQ